VIDKHPFSLNGRKYNDVQDEVTFKTVVQTFYGHLPAIWIDWTRPLDIQSTSSTFYASCWWVSNNVMHDDDETGCWMFTSRYQSSTGWTASVVGKAWW